MRRTLAGLINYYWLYYGRYSNTICAKKSDCSAILEKIEETGEFKSRPGSGIAFQIDVEDVVGVSRQVNELSKS